MSDAVIDNPILNSPFREPTRHWRFGDTGITNEIVEGRRPSSYFMPIPASKVRGKQLQLETQWTRDRIEENARINRVRQRVTAWRSLDWPGVTPTTRRLLEYWTNEQREKPLFFCQIEALETATTSPSARRSRETPGSPTSCESLRTRVSTGQRSRWRPGPARPWS